LVVGVPRDEDMSPAAVDLRDADDGVGDPRDPGVPRIAGGGGDERSYKCA
jgi:hypothetical protein